MTYATRRDSTISNSKFIKEQHGDSKARKRRSKDVGVAEP